MCIIKSQVINALNSSSYLSSVVTSHASTPLVTGMMLSLQCREVGISQAWSKGKGETRAIFDQLHLFVLCVCVIICPMPASVTIS